MAQVIFGDADEFDALAFGRPHPNTIQFLNNHAQQFTQNLTQAGQAFASTLTGLFDFVNYDRLAELARNVTRKVHGVWERDDIYSLVSLEQLQQANVFHQRWIMACPEVRELYHQQQCNGYHGTYIDVQPGVVGFQHYDYRRATDSLVLMEDDGWQATTYYEDLHVGDRHLLLSEQSDIQEMWAAARYHIRQGKSDPTSPTDDPL